MTQREIKYKRYHFDRNGTCIAVSWWGRNIDGFEFRSPTFISSEDPDKAIDCQFTGLQDKNGTDVYEGDKLRSVVDKSFLTWEVIFKNGCFGIRNIGIDGYVNHAEFYALDSQYYFEDREVIGNIHQTNEPL